MLLSHGGLEGNICFTVIVTVSAAASDAFFFVDKLSCDFHGILLTVPDSSNVLTREPWFLWASEAPLGWKHE